MKTNRCRALGRVFPSALFIAAITGVFALLANAAGGTYTVKIENMKFDPPTLTVHAGEKVIFQNLDIVPHTVSSVDKSEVKVESGTILSGKKFTLKVRKPGTIHYVCRFHPIMNGTINVAP